MKVNLTYFKASGKYYAKGDYITHLSPEDGLFKIWLEVEDMFERHVRPGLINGPIGDYIVAVKVPEHPHDHPRLMIPKS